MQRGVVNLSQPEVEYLIEITRAYPVELLLSQKLLAAKNTPASDNMVELSVDQAETLLDMLPMPVPNDTSPANDIRNTLRQFVETIR